MGAIPESLDHFDYVSCLSEQAARPFQGLAALFVRDWQHREPMHIHVRSHVLNWMNMLIEKTRPLGQIESQYCCFHVISMLCNLL